MSEGILWPKYRLFNEFICKKKFKNFNLTNQKTVAQLNRVTKYFAILFLIPSLPVVYGKIELITKEKLFKSNDLTNYAKPLSKWPWPHVCLGIDDLFIALFLV